MQNETQVTSTAWMGDAYLSTREPESWSDSTTLAIAPPEAAEKASREQFGIAFRDSAVAMGVMDVGGRFLRVNRALCGLMARSENELLAGSWQAMVHPEDVEEPLAYRRNALAGGADS